jgi:protein arginine N-methyltransferase 1
VIVSDLRGVLPLFRNHIPSIADARERFLAPGGQLIPLGDTLWVALVDARELYERHVIQSKDRVVELDVEAARRIVINTWRKGRIETEQLLVEPKCWATLDYATIEDPDVSGRATWTLTRAGTCYGLLIWFDTTLADGVGFSNAPGKPALIYGGGFFPWPDPVSLDIGDTIEIALRADLVGEDYVWRWDARIADSKEQLKSDFKQSTFQGNPFSPATLKKRVNSYIPELTEDGEIDRFILSLIDGRTSQGDIARRVVERFPARFAKWQEALPRLGELSQKYSH